VPFDLRSLHQSYVPSPIFREHMFEGGISNPKVMFFIVQLGAYACFSLGILGMDYWVTWKKGRALTIVLFPHLKWGRLILNPSPVGSPLLAYGFRKGTVWETLILVAQSRFPHPHFSLPSADYNPYFIIFLLWVHKALAHPLPLSTCLGCAWKCFPGGWCSWKNVKSMSWPQARNKREIIL